MRIFEAFPDGKKGEQLLAGDIMLAENLEYVTKNIINKTVQSLHMSPNCKRWSIIQNINGTTRTAQRPQGDGSNEEDNAANRERHLRVSFVLSVLQNIPPAVL